MLSSRFAKEDAVDTSARSSNRIATGCFCHRIEVIVGVAQVTVSLAGCAGSCVMRGCRTRVMKLLDLFGAMTLP